MATPKQVREAVADAIDAISGLRGHAYAPDQINPPAAVVIEVDVQFDAVMQRGADDFTVRVRLLTGGSLRAAQDKLWEMVSLLKDNIDGQVDTNVVSYARLARVRGDTEGPYEVGQRTFAGVDVDIEVVA